MSKLKSAGIVFGILFLLTVTGIVVASGVQNTWGAVNVSVVSFRTEDGYEMVAKLYKPKDLGTASTPIPGILAIHGYNNDKDVQRPVAIELSKRGMVVLAVDVLNHGDSGYANTSEVTAVPVAAMEYLRNLPFVDTDRIGVTGHSMGAFYTLLLTLPTFVGGSGYKVRAIAPIAFSPAMVNGYLGLVRMNNPTTDILQVSSWGEEFGREYNETINQFLQRGLDSIGAFLGISDPQYDHTYGTFGAGATRYENLKKTHPGQTHSRKSIAAITMFMMQSLQGYNEEYAEKYGGKNLMVYWISDLFGVISLAALIFSIIPLGILLTNAKSFKEVAQPMPKYRESYAPKTWVWWIFGIVNAAIGFVTYVFNTDYNKMVDGEDVASWVFDGTMLGKWFPNLYRSGIANDFEAFFLVNAGISILIVLFWYFVIYRPKRVGFYELGASYCVPTDELEGEKPHGWRIFGKTVAIAAILFVYMYGVTWVAAKTGVVEMRGPWSGLKLMTGERAADYLWYLPGPLLFWTFNAGIWMFGMMRQKERKTEAGTVFVWWIKICVVMLTGLVLLNVLQYVPMYLGFTGPWLNNWAIAPMNVLQLWSFVPYACGFYLVAIIFFRKTGKIWLGTLMCSAITTWMLVTGYIMF